MVSFFKFVRRVNPRLSSLLIGNHALVILSAVNPVHCERSVEEGGTARHLRDGNSLSRCPGLRQGADLILVNERITLSQHLLTVRASRRAFKGSFWIEAFCSTSFQTSAGKFCVIWLIFRECTVPIFFKRISICSVLIDSRGKVSTALRISWMGEECWVVEQQDPMV